MNPRDTLWTIETGERLLSNERQRRSAIAHTRRQGARYGYRGRIVLTRPDARHGRILIGVTR